MPAAAQSPSLNAVPKVTLTSPQSSTVRAPATLALAATASDSDGTIAKVAFYAGTTLLATDTSSPFSFSWANVPAGTYAIKAVATDNRGATASSATATVVVNTPPTVSLTSPAQGASFAAPATVALAAAASDSDGTIAKVAFYSGYTLVATDTSSPFSFSWANVPVGTYVIKAVATDNRGTSTSSATRTVTVIANSAPTVSLTSPAQGASFVAPATVALAAAASDVDGTIAKVVFYAGTTLVATDTASPFSFSWANVPVGTYVIKAVATDNRGTSTTSATRTVTVTASGAPTVSLTSPVQGASFAAPATVALAATASDIGGTIAKVVFYAGTTLLATDTSSPFSFSWANVPVGTYVFKAVATDNGGTSTTSATRTVTVTANTAPTVSLTSPVQGASFAAPATVALAATASDIGGTIAKVVFYAGTTLLATDTSSPFSFSWANVPVGTYVFKAVATDNGGTSTTSATRTVTVTANTAPTVLLTTPAQWASFAAPATVALAAAANDIDGTIAKVAFYAGTTLLATDTSSPFSFSWANVPVGTYVFKAVATDNGGTSTTSATRTVTVTATNNPAVVSLTSPAQGASFAAPATVALKASGSDTDGSVAMVGFYAGTTLLGTDATAPYEFVWTNVPAGSYSLTAVARDNLGAVTVSSTRDITVTATGTLSRAVFTPASIHNLVDRYVLDIFRAGSDPSVAVPLVSQNLGKPAVVNGECVADIRSMIAGLPAGTYIASVYAVAVEGTLRSAPSAPFSK